MIPLVAAIVDRLLAAPVGTSRARLACALVGHRWAGRPYFHLVHRGQTIAGRCTRCLLHVRGDTRHRPCPLPTASTRYRP